MDFSLIKYTRAKDLSQCTLSIDHAILSKQDDRDMYPVSYKVCMRDYEMMIIRPDNDGLHMFHVRCVL